MLKQLIDRIWSGGTNPQDSEIYALVHREITSGQMDTGLWTKAIAASDGNADKTKSRYIEMRVNVLRTEQKELMRFARKAEREKVQIDKESVERKRRAHEIQQLRAEELHLTSQLWIKFGSPDAKRMKRRRNIRNSLIYAIASILFYLTLSANELYIIPIICGFFVWVLSLATYGRLQLDDRLNEVRNRMANIAE